MTALHAVPEITEARGIVARIVPDPRPRWRARMNDRADRRHQVLVTLEELRRETPWYDVRARRALHKAIVRHIGMWF
jgi:hypothetical protein